MIYASQGRYNEAADSLAAVSGTGTRAPPGSAAAFALLRLSFERPPPKLPHREAFRETWRLWASSTFTWGPERVLEPYESTLKS